MTKDKRNSKEVNLVIEALEKRVDDLEKLVKCLLTPKVKELEESEATNGTKLDLQAKIYDKKTTLMKSNSNVRNVQKLSQTMTV
jgi:hypothetical protein